MSMENGVSAGVSRASPSGAAQGPARSSSGTAAPGGFAALLMSLGSDGVTADPGAGLEGEFPRDESDPVALATDAVQPGMADTLPVLPAVPSAEQIALPVRKDLSAGGTRATAGGGSERVETLAWQGAAAEDAQGAGPSAADASGADIQPFLRQAGLAQRLARQSRSEAAEAVQAAQAQRGEDMAARLAMAGGETTSVTGISPALQALASLGEGGWRPLERRDEKNASRSMMAGEAGVFAALVPADGVRPDVPVVAPDAGLTTEMRVAEQVSYWVGRGTQSAELEIDGIDERPVLVNITLQGQEARVEFRAEQAQTRQVLQDAAPHLREMLEREGLMLAGMSVGSSGADAGQGQSGRERPAARQAQVVVPEPVTARSAGASGGLAGGRSVDLFV